LQNEGTIPLFSKITKFEGIELENVIDILINNELIKIEELQLMKSELYKLWKVYF